MDCRSEFGLPMMPFVRRFGEKGHPMSRSDFNGSGMSCVKVP